MNTQQNKVQGLPWSGLTALVMCYNNVIFRPELSAKHILKFNNNTK